jgi:hypothetical protein
VFTPYTRWRQLRDVCFEWGFAVDKWSIPESPAESGTTT